MTAITPFQLDVDDAELEELRSRLRRTRWPDPETVSDWSQGVPLAYLQDVCRYWADDYQWRRVERQLNDIGQFRTEIDGVGIHFLHRRSPHDGALPLILTHGWPGSVVEFLKVIGPLTDPPAHGGDAPFLPEESSPGPCGAGLGHCADRRRVGAADASPRL